MRTTTETAVAVAKRRAALPPAAMAGMVGPVLAGPGGAAQAGSSTGGNGGTTGLNGDEDNDTVLGGSGDDGNGGLGGTAVSGNVTSGARRKWRHRRGRSWRHRVRRQRDGRQCWLGHSLRPRRRMTPFWVDPIAMAMVVRAAMPTLATQRQPRQEMVQRPTAGHPATLSPDPPQPATAATAL